MRVTCLSLCAKKIAKSSWKSAMMVLGCLHGNGGRHCWETRERFRIAPISMGILVSACRSSLKSFADIRGTWRCSMRTHVASLCGLFCPALFLQVRRGRTLWGGRRHTDMLWSDVNYGIAVE